MTCYLLPFMIFLRPFPTCSPDRILMRIPLHMGEKCSKVSGCHLVPLHTLSLAPTSNLIAREILSKGAEEKFRLRIRFKEMVIQYLPPLLLISPCLPPIIFASFLSFCHTDCPAEKEAVQQMEAELYSHFLF